MTREKRNQAPLAASRVSKSFCVTAERVGDIRNRTHFQARTLEPRRFAGRNRAHAVTPQIVALGDVAARVLIDRGRAATTAATQILGIDIGLSGALAILDASRRRAIEGPLAAGLLREGLQ